MGDFGYVNKTKDVAAETDVKNFRVAEFEENFIGEEVSQQFWYVIDDASNSEERWTATQVLIVLKSD